LSSLRVRRAKNLCDTLSLRVVLLHPQLIAPKREMADNMRPSKRTNQAAKMRRLKWRMQTKCC